jgi:formylglycine-generating enzyme required for sulfatase activity
VAKKVALLIGVSQYGEGFPPLSAAPNDVAALKKVLENPEMAGFDEVIPLIDPDLAAMQSAIGKFFSDRAKDDLLLLYFSGHGIKDGDTNHLYLASCQTSKEEFRWQAVPASFVQQRSQFCPSRRQVIILDCCFSGAFKDGWIPKGTGLDLQQELGKEGRAVLTSSNEFEQSFQQDTGEALSLYTQYLVEGIETGAADSDKDGNIYVMELHDYAKAKVQEVKPKMQPGILSDKEGFEILLSKAPVNDPGLDFRRLVEPYAQKGAISKRRREILQVESRKLGLTDEAAEAIINSVLEPFRRRLANLEKFETELRKEVTQQFPLTADIETELRDWQQGVLGLTNEDVAEIWKQVIAEKERARPAVPPVAPPPPPPTPAAPVSPRPPISTFEFQVATLRKKTETQGGVLGFGKKEAITYSIDRTQKRTDYFTEKLSDRVFLEMVAIPAGRFQMGSTEYSSEQPVHQVAIAPFFLGKYPVTQAQWQAVAAFPKVKIDLNPDPANFEGDDRPVEQVSWWEAMEFCDRLSRKTNRTYRLPSEAEWEYACRAGTTTPFHFGETITTDLANYNGNYTYGSGAKGEYRQSTTSVGNFGVANAFGLYDMHGNVWEWCADRWHENYEGAPNDGSAWLTDNQEAQRLLRGGSWDSDPRHCRSAYRAQYAPDDRNYNVGFRVVCVSSWTA